MKTGRLFRFAIVTLGLGLFSSGALGFSAGTELVPAQKGVPIVPEDGRIVWEHLIDPVNGRYDDPFEALSSSELRSLGMVMRAREVLKNPKLSSTERDQVQGELHRHEALLQAAGVDVNGLLAKREEVALEKAKASLAGNPAVEGREVRLTGYVIPLFSEGGKDLGGYLVPQAGMCSHYPPPAPNQMIYFGPGHAWDSAYVYQPVELRGQLTHQVSRQEITLLDGQVEMISAFTMDLEGVTVLEQTGPNPKVRSFDLFGSMKRLLGSD